MDSIKDRIRVNFKVPKGVYEMARQYLNDFGLSGSDSPKTASFFFCLDCDPLSGVSKSRQEGDFVALMPLYLEPNGYIGGGGLW